MTKPDSQLPSPPVAASQDLDLSTALAIVLERWWVVVRVVGVIGLATVALLLLQRRKYEAAMTLTTVDGGGILSGGIAATLLAGSTRGGLQATPPFVVQLAQLPGVLRTVGDAPLTAGSSTTILERVAQVTGTDSITFRMVPEVLGGMITASIQRETGTIALQVRSRDSALARAMAHRVVEIVGRTFVEASRSQASEMRRAQQERVDSATSQLDKAERDLLAFSSRNRAPTPFSSAVVERRRLERAQQVAEQVYLRAVSDRDAAIAKELEETPAVVVLDSLPASLPPVRQRRIMKLALVLILATIGTTFYLVLGDSAARGGAGREGTARLREAWRNLPFSRLLRRRRAGA